MKPEIREILKAMEEDSRIRVIVTQILRMSVEEREQFKKKVMYYFMDRNSEVDTEAFKFFKIVIENVEELSKLIEQK
ncbi:MULTISPECIES: hypothetical protein [unclassified Thermotoga]|uniref:hypothetical protein n=1 Tax=unclassified Thermotoga TaxID=2631113 RepID=UPI0005437253|nr:MULTISPECIES: hypothetical protein [unclassified Thermotoga]KAF2959631.1 hypothetical protein AS158_04065 [Thermotoga sp. 38H-to]KHC90656.1 hypothetical protein Mc24_06993 [Thermotoga sp. Mc24]